MTPSHAVKKTTRYRYYISRPLITKDPADRSAGLRIPAGEIEQLVAGRVRQWLLLCLTPAPGDDHPSVRPSSRAVVGTQAIVSLGRAGRVGVSCILGILSTGDLLSDG